MAACMEFPYGCMDSMLNSKWLAECKISKSCHTAMRHDARAAGGARAGDFDFGNTDDRFQPAAPFAPFDCAELPGGPTQPAVLD